MKVRYSGLIENDFVDGNGVCVSFWTQGCPFRCNGCHNPETWSFDGGLEIEYDQLIGKILDAISANGIQRNFSILGGEPLCQQNIELVSNIIYDVRSEYPNINIYLWTGNLFENLMKNNDTKEILSNINILVDGQFILEQRDVTLKLRGSTNQRVIDVKQTLQQNKLILIPDQKEGEKE